MKILSKWWKVILVLLCLNIFLYMFYYYRIRPTANTEHTYLTNSASEEQICSNDIFLGKSVIEQKFTGTRNEITSINLMFRKSADVDSNIIVEFVDENSGEIIKTWQLTASMIGDYQYVYLPFDSRITIANGTSYIIRVISNDLGIVSPALADYDAFINGYVEVEGEIIENTDMLFSLQGLNDFLKIFYMCCILIINMGCFSLGVLIVNKHKKIENYFLVLGITWGSLFLILFPPNTAPDEHYHIATAYAHANMAMGRECVNSEGFVIVRETDAAIENYNQVSLESYAHYYDQLLSDNSEELTVFNFTKLDIPYFSNLPQTIGVLIGWLLHANGMITLYLGKLFALIFYLCGCYFAIKCIPWGKMLMTIIALFPMSLELASSFSYDCTIITISFMFIAYTMKLIYEKLVVNWKDYLLLVVLSAWMVPCKVIYLLICCLVFLIPFKKTNNRKISIVGKGSTFLVGIVLMLVYRMDTFIKITTLQSVHGSSEDIKGFTIGQILSNPVHSLGMLFNTFFEQCDYYLGTMVGRLLGWLQVNISWYIICGFIIVLGLALISETENKQYMTKYQKIVVICASILMFGGTVLAMWLDFTPNYWKYIVGVQGRYFIPFLPMLLMTFKGNLFTIKKNIDIPMICSLFIFEALAICDVWKYIIM